MASPELQSLGMVGVVLIAAERIVSMVREFQAKRNGGGVIELLHRIRESQVEQTVLLRELNKKQ